MVEEASKFPLSNKIIIEKEVLLDMIEDIKLKLPDEINKANWVAKERQRILSEAESEAEEIVETARRQQENLISETEIVRIATQKADEILFTSDRKVNEMKNNAVEYCDNIISNMCDNLDAIQAMLEKNREELKNI